MDDSKLSKVGNSAKASSGPAVPCQVLADVVFCCSDSFLDNPAHPGSVHPQADPPEAMPQEAALLEAALAAAPETAPLSNNVGAYSQRERHAQSMEEDGTISFQYVQNDGDPNSLMRYCLYCLCSLA